jgi:hypothetical protein
MTDLAGNYESQDADDVIGHLVSHTQAEGDLFRFVLVFFLFRQARQRDHPFAFFQFD